MPRVHELHDFLSSTQRWLQEEYERIQSRAGEDPGTAGDEGEENWATILREWLPSYFHVVTKGRVLFDDGVASPQVDILILKPAYPRTLLTKKLYLAAGVVAAFECKVTLKAAHVAQAVKTAAFIKGHLPKTLGSPYKELNSSIIFGLLAHSHSWRSAGSNPISNVDEALSKADRKFVDHPIKQLDFITVSDLASWQVMKTVFLGPKWPHWNDVLKTALGENGSATSGYLCAAIGGERQEAFFTPIGALLAGLFSRLSWSFEDMRSLGGCFCKVGMGGSSSGFSRHWPITIYSESIRSRVYEMEFTKGVAHSEWHSCFI